VSVLKGVKRRLIKFKGEGWNNLHQSSFSVLLEVRIPASNRKYDTLFQANVGDDSKDKKKF